MDYAQIIPYRIQKLKQLLSEKTENYCTFLFVIQILTAKPGNILISNNLYKVS